MSTYDAFISYSLSADGHLAPAVQVGLQRLAKPWAKRRALEVFRDETGLSVSPDLWESIAGVLDASEWFVVLASPEAAASKWVDKEVAHWLASRPDAARRILLVRTAGVLEWDARDGGFTASSDALPPALALAFSAEPRFVDLSWAHQEDHLDLGNPRFRQAVAEIAAPMHGISQDQLVGADVRLHRRAVRIRRIVMAALVALTLGALVASLVAVRNSREADAQRNEAQTQATLAEDRRVVAESAEALATQRQREAEDAAIVSRSSEFLARSRDVVDSNPELAALFAVEASFPDGASRTFAVDGARDAIGIAARAITTANAHRLAGEMPAFDTIAFDPQSPVVALAEGDVVRIYDRADPTLFGLSEDSSNSTTRPIVEIEVDEVNEVVQLEISPDGGVVVVLESDRLPNWHAAAFNTSTGEELWSRDVRQVLDISSRGQLALHVDLPAGPAVVVADAATGEQVLEIPLRPAGSNLHPDVSTARFSPDGNRLAIAQHPSFADSEFSSTGDSQVSEVLRIYPLESPGDEIITELGEVLGADGSPLWTVGEPMRLEWLAPPFDGPSGPITDGDAVIALDDANRIHAFYWSGPIAQWLTLGASARTSDVSFPYPSTIAVDPNGATLALITPDNELLVGDSYADDGRGQTSPSSLRDGHLSIGWWADDVVLVYDDFLGRGVRYGLGEADGGQLAAPPSGDEADAAVERARSSEHPSPNGEWVAHFGPGTPDGIVLEEVATTRRFDLDGSDYSALTWHPNGRLIAGRTDGSLELVDPSTGASRTVGAVTGRRVAYLAVSADGDRIYAVSDASEIDLPFGWVVTLDGTMLDGRTRQAAGPIITADDGTGFWVYEPFSGSWDFVPDSDPRLACSLATEAARLEFESTVGSEPVCATLGSLADD